MLIGRKTEIKLLEKIYHSKQAEFVVLYGRRRIGKTFLVREFFGSQKCLFMQATGMQKGTLKQQLSKFSESFSNVFMSGIALAAPKSWQEAFQNLNKAIENDKSGNKIVIFLDELPWMATKKSGLLQEIDYFWNQYWSKNPKIIFIVCGSNASWLINNIIYNTGGLHNRCTLEIKLNPFTLFETKEYFKSKNIHLNDQHILEIYMALGGIPYYLNYVSAGLSAAENIQNILFADNAPLQNEFNKLFNSLFKNAEVYIELIKLIASKKDGLSRIELAAIAKQSNNGGRLSKRLEQLIQTNFIASHVPFKKERGEYFKVIDEFCLFYLYWINNKNYKNRIANHWLKQIQKPEYHVWCGYAFEAVCYKHISAIIKALHLHTAEFYCSWRYIHRGSVEQGAQIDLLFDRSDDAITLCEIKYTNAAFAITKPYADNLRNKINIFKQHAGTHKQIFMAMISANGVQENQYSNEILSGIVTLKNLFKD